MTDLSSAPRYDKVAIALHWSSALLIVATFVLSLTIDLFPKTMKDAAINFHALFGLAILALAIWRLVWRINHKPPPLPATDSALNVKLAHLGHMALYALMLLIPIIGIPTLLFRGRGLDFGLFKIASPFVRDRAIFGPLTEVHEIASWAMVALVVGHVGAALYHHVAQRDGTLLRMMPRPKA